MSRWFPALLALAFYLAHQDFWFWRTPRPFALGTLPAGLWYHAAYTLCVPLVMIVLLRRYWPHHLEDAVLTDASHDGATDAVSTDRTPDAAPAQLGGPRA